MAAPLLLGLPPISPNLKAITPYLQRADELRAKEPVMAYWSAYHAAQVGISLKAKDTQSRNVLFELLGVLETMKKEIGPNDAIDIEAASAAYVENFGLKIFAMADNEDRRGTATRSTAKKFLAAANFLEVLKVFPKTEASDSVEEKIKYAKWKAADIAKAFREGRKPTPGPAGQPPAVEASSPSPTPEVHSQNMHLSSSPSQSQSQPGASSSRTSPPPSPKHATSSPTHRASPPRMHPVDIAKANLPHTPHKATDYLGVYVPPGEGDSTPGSWSTAATPGNDGLQVGIDSPIPPVAENYPRRGSIPGGSNHHRKMSSVSSADDEMIRSLRSFPGVDCKKAVHFTPGVADGSPILPRHHLSDVNIPPSLVPDSAIDLTFANTTGGPVIPPPPPPFQTPPDPVSPTVYRRPVIFEASPPSISQSLAYPAPQSQSPQRPYPPPPSVASAPDPIISTTSVELTPSVIAKAQKHCRFAISALDYEDADQARKDLMAALAALGVRIPGCP